MPAELPPRAMMSLLDDPSVSLSFQYNPAEIEEKLSANFAELDVLGQSHKPDQYRNTDNLEVSFEASFDGLSLRVDGDVVRARNTLHSFLYSRRGAQSIGDASPGRVVFDWPNLYAIECKVRSVDGKFTRFDASLKPTLYSAKVVIFESRLSRLYAEDVRARGTIRR